jgi:hypothetical protein
MSRHTICAKQLCGDHIGTTIRFRQWDNHTEISEVITAELRQLSHSGAETHVVYGVGASKEARLDPEQPVSLNPPTDYSDVSVWLTPYDDQV